VPREVRAVRPVAAVASALRAAAAVLVHPATTTATMLGVRQASSVGAAAVGDARRESEAVAARSAAAVAPSSIVFAGGSRIPGSNM
jgi:hypothetical protein